MPEDDKKREQQAKADANRRSGHFQVRLDKQLSAQLQHYADRNHDGFINPALKAIVSLFFNGK